MSQQQKPNRIRKQFSTTLDVDTLWLIRRLTRDGCMGRVVEDAVKGWLKDSAVWWVGGSVGMVQLQEEALYYVWVDLNGEVLSDPFRTYEDAFTWLQKIYPEVQLTKN